MLGPGLGEQTSSNKIIRVKVVQYWVDILLQGVSKQMELSQVRCENHQLVCSVSLLTKVFHNLQYHFHFEYVALTPFRTLVPAVRNSQKLRLKMAMVEKDNAIL